MDLYLVILIAGGVLLFSVLASKMMYRWGVPTLIIFLSLGMLLGSDGPGGIYFDDYNFASRVAEIALMIIIFSGGFDTSWKTAKKSAPLAFVLSSFGTFLTAFLVGIFAHFALNLSWFEGLLIGSIISSTDAASVFAILRSKNLNLKGDLAATLEIESGSNDPFSNMLTLLFIALIEGNATGFGLMFFLQIVVGVVIGIGIGYIATWLINHINLAIDGLYIIVALAVMMLSFGIASALGGNGFLAVYLSGIFLGNQALTHKISLVKFFDGLTWLMQIVLFFTLGLLVFPTQVMDVIWQGLAIAVFISFIGRPLAIAILMLLFRRPWKEITLVSWVGFRGAASIVFATYPLVHGLPAGNLIFNVVFFVAIFSVAVQGTLLIPLANKLGLTEKTGTVLTTFTDYRGDTYADLLSIDVPKDAIAVGKQIVELQIPPHILIALIKRGNSVVTPRAHTVIQAHDVLMLASDSVEELLDVKKMTIFQPNGKAFENLSI